jgi:hypothetical protein
MEDKKKLIIQIPDEIIRNQNFKMDSNAFAVYSYLKFLMFRNYNSNELEIDHNQFKHKLYIADNRTLKKSFTLLHKERILLEYIDKFPTKGRLTLTFEPVPFETKTFTQLPATVINKIEQIGTIGMRLLFYYESFINRKDEPSKQFAFPSIETAAKSLGVNKETILAYNIILKKNKLLKVVKHELDWFGQYDDLDKPLFTKYNNHYFVKLENL